MKAQIIGNEYIRHELKLKEIIDFYEMIDRHNIKEGERFVFSTYDTPPTRWCFNIDHENLKVEFTWGTEKGHLITDQNYDCMTVTEYRKRYQ